MTKQWIMTVPVVSTVHMKPETNQAFLAGINGDVNVHSLDDCGWLIWCGEEQDAIDDSANENDSEVYLDITEIMRWARKNGSNGWMRLDGTADVIDELPKYEWS